MNEGKLDGFGDFLWPEGKKYCGYYKNDKKDKYFFGICKIKNDLMKKYLCLKILKLMLAFGMRDI